LRREKRKSEIAEGRDCACCFALQLVWGGRGEKWGDNLSSFLKQKEREEQNFPGGGDSD